MVVVDLEMDHLDASEEDLEVDFLVAMDPSLEVLEVVVAGLEIVLVAIEAFHSSCEVEIFEV